jgi:hypothetical protein
MDKIENLQEKAHVLRDLLGNYALFNSDAEMVLGFMAPLFARIEAGQVIPPEPFPQQWYFGSTDSPLHEFDDLCEAAARFSHVLRDWPS